MANGFRNIFLSAVLVGLAAPGPALAADIPSTTKVSVGSLPPSCTITTRSDEQKQISVPDRLTLRWRDTPMTIRCEVPGQKPVQKVLPRPRDGWVPTNVVIDDMAIVFLDASPGYRKRRPASVSVTFYPTVFEDYEEKNAWYNERRTQIDEFTAARQREIYQNVTECKFVATCLDAEEELTARKARVIKELDRLRGLIRVRAGALVLKTSTRTICLTQVSDTIWEAGTCPSRASAANKPTLEMTRIKVDGRTECVYRVEANTWESRPCPKN
ncbi:MAG: hypothetical protein ACI9JL_001787 [Paracoccaceae bacterium]|jgi:hypothetical protein